MTSIEKLYTECTTPETEVRILARTIYNYLISPFIVYCDRFVSEDKKDPIHEFQKLIFEQGLEHEKKVIEEEYPSAEKHEYETKEEGFRLLLECMAKGVDEICSLPVLYLQEGLEGRFDVIEKKDTNPSIFGDYHYVIKEIKLAKNLKKHHIYQAAFYNYLLGKIQGYTPKSFYMINRDHEEKEYPYKEEELLLILRDIKEILKGKDVSPTYGVCEWPWETYNNEEAIRKDDVSLVTGIGASTKEKLNEAGIKTVKDLANAGIEELTTIKGIGEKKAEKFKTNARSLLKGECIPLQGCSFPENKTEIFLDLEGTGEQKGDEELVSVDYLIGVILRQDGREEYKAFLAKNPEKEGEMFKEFTEWLKEQEDFTIYHWHNYELNHLKRLSNRYKISGELEDRMFENMRDLYKDAVKTFAYPTYGSGLKDVAHYMGYSWRHQDVNAMESIAIYFNFIKDPSGNREELKKVIDYNEDDCRATMLVKDWLEENSNL